jgi:hypothetical protein
MGRTTGRSQTQLGYETTTCPTIQPPARNGRQTPHTSPTTPTNITQAIRRQTAARPFHTERRRYTHHSTCSGWPNKPLVTSEGIAGHTCYCCGQNNSSSTEPGSQRLRPRVQNAIQPQYHPANTMTLALSGGSAPAHLPKHTALPLTSHEPSCRQTAARPKQ